MKNTTRIITWCLLAAVLLAGSTASAGMLDRFKNKGEKEHKVAPRYDRFPTIHYHVGQLQQSGFDGWKVGDLNLQVAKTCVVTGSDGEETRLSAGSDAIVSGALIGDTFVALRVRILSSDWNSGPRDPNVKVERSDSDPTVGIGTGPL